jgi:hypothetical protein
MYMHHAMESDAADDDGDQPCCARCSSCGPARAMLILWHLPAAAGWFPYRSAELMKMTAPRRSPGRDVEHAGDLKQCRFRCECKFVDLDQDLVPRSNVSVRSTGCTRQQLFVHARLVLRVEEVRVLMYLTTAFRLTRRLTSKTPGARRTVTVKSTRS